MAWIESHDTLGAHPKTRKLARTLGVSRVQAVGHLQFFWWWAMSYAEDGILAKFIPLDIATGAEWEGDEFQFFEAMIVAGFIDRDENGLTVIHDWNEYGGKLVRRKNANVLRMRETRAEHVQNTFGKRAEPEKRRVENSTEEALPSVEISRARKGRPSSPRIPLPDDWQPPFDDVIAAQEFKLAPKVVHLETEQFKDHHRKVGSQFADWNAAWRNWMRRVPEFSRGSPSLNGHNSAKHWSPESIADYARDLEMQGR